MSFTDISWVILFSLLRPSIIIASAGPYVTNLCLNLLRATFFARAISPEIPVHAELEILLRDRWAAALKNWTIQIYTVLMSFVIVLSEIAASFAAAVRHPRFTDIITDGRHHAWVVVAFLLCLSGLVLCTYLLLSRTPKPKVVALYLPPEGDPHGADYARPPVTSPLTFARIILLVVGWIVYATAWNLGVVT